MNKLFNEANQIHNFMFSSSGGTVIDYGSGSDFLTSYGSGSTGQKVTVPTVPVPVSQHWANDTYRINSWRSASILLIYVIPPGFGDFRMARRTITANSLFVTFPTRAAAALTLLSSFLQTNIYKIMYLISFI